jgi:cellulose biosynthesis protein BcsQ
MRTIIVTNQKGGCGKTTTAVNLAAALAIKGQKILLIDIDPQAHATLGMGYNPDELEQTIYHPLTNTEISISEVIVSTKIEGLDLVPSNIMLANADLRHVIVSRREYTLRERLKEVSNKYDICVIDCPPSLGLLTLNALVASTDIIVPVQTHYYALEGLKQLLETVKDARKRFHPCSVKILGILLTFVEGNVALSQQVEEQMRQFFGNLVFDTVIHNTVSLAEAPSAGESIFTYAPESKGAAEYASLAEEVTDPEYKRKRKHPKEVSVIVEKAVAAKEAAVLHPSKEKEAKEPALVEAAPVKVVRKKFDFISVMAILLVIILATLLIVVSVTNSPPVATPDSAVTQEDTPVEIMLAGTDSDRNDQLTYIIVTYPSHGSISGIPPNVTYTPELNYNGSDNFTFAVNDGTLSSYPAIISLKITPVNDTPVAKAQSIITKIDKSASITLRGSDIDGDSFNPTVYTQPRHGTLIIGSDFYANGTLIYNPEPQYTGPDSFTFKVSDGTMESVPATVSIDVIPNYPPVAEQQSLTTAENTSAEFTITSSDPDGDKLVYNIVKRPSHGKLSGTEPNLIYTPDEGFNGTDSFTFKTSDGVADSALATVSIRVTPVNDPPVANSDNITTSEEMPISINLTGEDPENDSLTYEVITEPSHGKLSGIEPILTYTPRMNFNGSDSFTFKTNDGRADSEPATISITVSPINDKPVAVRDSTETLEDTPVSITLTGSDYDGDELTYSIASGPFNGTLSGTEPNVIYTPNKNFSGTDRFSFIAYDGELESFPATVSIVVNMTEDLPEAKDCNATTQEDKSVAILLSGTDADNDPLTFSVVTGPSNGILSKTEPNVIYTPNMNFYGTDSFTYIANDGTGDSAPAIVKITVTPTDDPPIANNANVTIQEDSPVWISLMGIDPDGDSLKYTIVEEPSHGSVSGIGANLSYKPDTNFSGTDTIKFKVNDGKSESEVATIYITVNAANDPPVVNSGVATTQEDMPVSIALIADDIDGDELTYHVVSGPSNGNLSGAAPNLTYAPNMNFNGTDSFTFKANDGLMDSTPATFSIEVTPVNDSPTAYNHSEIVMEDSPVLIALTAGDPDGDSLTYIVVKGPSHGSLSGTEPNITYTPDEDYSGSDSLTFIASDGQLDSATAVISIKVTPVNDRPVANNDSLTTYEDASVSIVLTGSDVDNDQLVYSVVTKPSYGKLSGTEPNLTYTPNENFNGPDSFTFKARDSVTDSELATVSITVTPDNDAPIANKSNVTTLEDTPVSITLTGRDPDTYMLIYTIVTRPSHGVLTGTEPNLTYTPYQEFSGADSFTFTANDGLITSEPATISINVEPVNDLPLADNDTVFTWEDTPVTIELKGHDPENKPLIYRVETIPSKGKLSGTEQNLTYTPETDFYGSDSFTFTVSDGEGDSVPATISIKVESVGDSPLAHSQSATTYEDIPVPITLTGEDPDSDLLTYNLTTTPTHGVLNGIEPNLVYTPNPDFNGSDSFTFTVNDGETDSVPGTVSITITPVGDWPTAYDDEYETQEEKPVQITLKGSDPDGDSLVYSVVTGPSHGSLSGTEPNLIYTPYVNFNGSDSFTFKTNDGTADSVNSTISVKVLPVNDSPIANIDSVTTQEDVPISITLTGSDPDEDSLEYSVATGPSHGTLNGTAPDLVYIPSANFNGSDSFTFKVNDGKSDDVLGTVSITVEPVNDPPTVTGDKVSAQEDIPLPIALIASDPDGYPLTYEIVTAPSHGTLSGSPPNMTYTPNKDFNGSDGFTFKASDGLADSVLATVSITIIPVNDPPMADSDNIKINEDTPVWIGLTGSDIDGDAFTFSLVEEPSHGNLSGTMTNLTYMPNEDFYGSDKFTFKANDGKEDSAVATISITVVPVNDPPMVESKEVVTQEDTPLSIIMDSHDMDGDELTYRIISGPLRGTLSGKAPNLTYTPETNYSGPDIFTFVVSDGISDSAVASVSITVNSVNDPPIAEGGSVTTQEDTPVSIDLSGTDPEGHSLTYHVVSKPSYGSLDGTEPNLIYLPNNDFSGSDSFTFKVNDGEGDSSPATISISVKPVDDAPKIIGGSATTQEDIPVWIALMASDPDGDPLTYTVVQSPSHGELSGTAPTLAYKPDKNYNGPDSFSFKVNDGKTDSVPATVSITITPVDDEPIAHAGSVKIQEGESTSITLEGSDPEGNPLTYTVVTSPFHGNLTGTAPNLTYTPNENYNGRDSFTFRASDGTTESVPATVSITVIAVGDAPIAKHDSSTTQEDVPITIDVLRNDIEMDNEAIAISTVTQGINGSVIVNEGKAVTYTPRANFHGNDTFTYTISDASGDTDTATVYVKVNAVNDKPTINTKPITEAMVGTLYTYDVNATDADNEDELIYSLVEKPFGMSIYSNDGLIQWRPAEAQVGDNKVVVEVIDSNITLASDTQTFTIKVNPIPPRVSNLTVVNGYDQRTKGSLSATGRVSIVQNSDDKRLEVESGSYVSLEFSDLTIPAEAKITTVVVFVEHYEEEKYVSGKLKWNIGKGWPLNPVIWVSTSAPLHKGEQYEVLDSWDVTSFVDTPEKVNSLQIQIDNNRDTNRAKTFVDYVYVLVRWDLEAPQTDLVEYELQPVQ